MGIRRNDTTRQRLGYYEATLMSQKESLKNWKGTANAIYCANNSVGEVQKGHNCYGPFGQLLCISTTAPCHAPCHAPAISAKILRKFEAKHNIKPGSSNLVALYHTRCTCTLSTYTYPGKVEKKFNFLPASWMLVLIWEIWLDLGLCALKLCSQAELWVRTQGQHHK